MSDSYGAPQADGLLPTVEPVPVSPLRDAIPGAARELFIDHCYPGDRAALQRYGEAPAVAAIWNAILRCERGDIELHVVWSLKPGQPQIVAVCSSPEIAERYRSYVDSHHRGQFYVELVYLDHAFGRRDIQSTIYRAALQTKGVDERG